MEEQTKRETIRRKKGLLGQLPVKYNYVRHKKRRDRSYSTSFLSSAADLVVSSKLVKCLGKESPKSVT